MEFERHFNSIVSHVASRSNMAPQLSSERVSDPLSFIVWCSFVLETGSGCQVVSFIYSFLVDFLLFWFIIRMICCRYFFIRCLGKHKESRLHRIFWILFRKTGVRLFHLSIFLSFLFWFIPYDFMSLFPYQLFWQKKSTTRIF